MKTRLLGFFIVTFVVLNAIVPGAATAADGERKVAAMSEKTFQRLSTAQNYIDQGDYAGALNVLDGYLLSSKRLNTNEIGQIQNMRGFAFFQQEDYARAIQAYELVVAQAMGIPIGLESTTTYTLAQLNFVQEQYDRARDYMHRWRGMVASPSIDSDMFLAQVALRLNDYAEARALLFATLDRALAEDKPFKHTWFAFADYLDSYADVGFDSKEWDAYIEKNRPFADLVPVYPAQARQDGVEGWVQIEFTLSKTGEIVDPTGVGEPFGVFEQAAAKAFSEAAFEPYTWRDKPVDTQVTGTLRFKLN